MQQIIFEFLFARLSYKFQIFEFLHLTCLVYFFQSLQVLIQDFNCALQENFLLQVENKFICVLKLCSFLVLIFNLWQLILLDVLPGWRFLFNTCSPVWCSIRSYELTVLFCWEICSVIMFPRADTIHWLQGHMYLFERYICFYSNLFGFETKVWFLLFFFCLITESIELAICRKCTVLFV